MANETIINPNECIIAGTKFPLSGPIRRTQINRFPGKVNYGDDSFAREQVLSNWIISDQRGGIGIEEMIEGIHNDRCWISELDLRFKGHMLLPPYDHPSGSGGLTSKDLKVSFDYDGATYAAFDEYLRIYDNTNNDFNDAVMTMAASPTDCAEIMNAMMICLDDSGYELNPKLWLPAQLTDGGLEVWTTATNLTNWTEVEFDASSAVTQESTTVDAGNYAAKLYSGDNFGDHADIYQDLGTLTDSGIAKLLRGKAIRVTARINTDNASGVIVRIGDGVTDTDQAAAGTGAFETVTCNKTMGAAAVSLRISIIATTEAGPATTTAYVDKIAISYQETSDPFCSMTHQEAKHAIEWDGKAFIMDADGKIYYSTDFYTWTQNGQLKLPADEVNRLAIYRDATGTEIIYAATKRGVYAYDYTNAKFLATEMALPSHAEAGLGFTRWRDGLFTSAGLDVIKYIAGNPATISEVGLNLGDGLEASYASEIYFFIKGYNELFALIDPSYTAATRPIVARFDGYGWQIVNTGSAQDHEMKWGHISSSYSTYRLWFGKNEGASSITLQKSLQNPKKDSTYKYGDSKQHITPWFDAGTSVFAKTAHSVSVFASDTTAAEYIDIQYRIDHVKTDRNTGWTTMTNTACPDGHIDAAGNQVTQKFLFASGAGLSFKSIQFRFTFERGTITLSPDLQSFVFSYTKEAVPIWAWTIPLDLKDAPRIGAEPKALYDALITAVEAGTLQQFIYRDGNGSDDEHYCLLHLPGSLEASGQQFDAKVVVTATEP